MSASDAPAPTESPALRVAVANPGSIPELGHLASFLGSASELSRYFVPIAFSEGEKALRFVRPNSLRRRVAEQRHKRLAPNGVQDFALQTLATGAELAFQASLRTSATRRVSGAILSRRNRLFDSGVARRLTGDESAIVARSTAAVQTFRRAKDLAVPRVLDYPIAHHEFESALAIEERESHPALAASWPLTFVSGSQRRQLDEEIDLADRIIVFSEYHARTFLSAGVPHKKLIISPLGVDTEIFRGAPRPRSNGERMRVVWVGQLTQRKGLSYALEAARELQHVADFTFIGSDTSGNMRSYVAQAGGHWMEPMSRPQLAAEYRRHHVFLLPTLVEGFPQTPLEAMASGLVPIISENAYGPETVVIDHVNGLVVPIRDTQAIVRAVQSCLVEDFRIQLATSAVDTAAQLTWTQFAVGVRQGISDLLSESSG